MSGARRACRPAFVACVLALVLSAGFSVGSAQQPTTPAPTASAPAPAAPAGAPSNKPMALVHHLKGHEELVYCVAYSPDGKLLATASFDKTVKLWDAATGKLLKTFAGPTGHQNLVLHVAFSSDGKLLASCGSDNTVKQWDVPSAEPLRSFVGHEGALRAAALSPDGSRLATAGADKTVRLWEAATGKLLFTCAGHGGEVKGLAFSANGQQLFSVGADQQLRVWNVADGQPAAAAGAHASSVNAVAALPSGSALLTIGEDGLLKLWQTPLASSRLLNPPHGGAISGLALSGDGARLFSASADKTLRVSTVAAAGQERLLSGPTQPATAVAVAGATAAAATADQQVFLWNLTDGKALGQLPANSVAIASLALHPQGKELLLGQADGQLRIRPLPLEQERAFAHPDVVGAMATTPAGDRAFTATSDKLVRGWNLATGQSDQQHVGLSAPALALLASGDKLLAGSGDGEVLSWKIGVPQPAERLGAHAAGVAALIPLPGVPDLVTASLDGSVKRWKPGTAPKPLAHPGNVTCAAASADGKKLLTGAADHQVRLWNLETNQVEKAFGGATQPIRAVALSADGSKVAFVSADQSLRICQTADGKEVFKDDKLPAAPTGIDFSPKGDQLAWSAADGKVRVLTAADGKAVKELAGHAGAVATVRFLPAGERLVTVGADNTLQVWTLADGKSVIKIAHPPGLSAFALSPDGKTILTGAADKLVRFWNPADGKPAGQMAVAAEPKALALRGDGLRLLVGAADGRSLLYDRDGNLLEFGQQPGAVNAVAFAADGQGWLAAGADKEAKRFTPSLVWAARFAGGLRCALYHPGTKEIVAAGDDKTIKFIRPSDGVAVRIYSGHQAAVNELALSKDGKLLASASADQKVWLWNLADHRPVRAIAAGAAVTGLGFSDDSKSLFVAVGPSLKRIDTASGQEQPPLATAATPILRLLRTEDAKTKQPVWLASTADKAVRILGSAQPRAIPAHQGAVAAVAVHPNGTQALTGGADKTVKLWDLAAGKELRSFAGMGDAVTAVAFSREATPTKAAAAGLDKTVRVWNLADGKELLKLTHAAAVRGLAFSPDGSRLATATDAGRVAVFDAVTGQELQFSQQPGAVASVLFSADGRTVIFGGADKNVTLAPAAVSKAIAAAPVSPLLCLAPLPGGAQALVGAADGSAHLFNLTTGKIDRTLKAHAGPVRAVAVHKSGLTLFTAGADKTIKVWNAADGKELKSLPAPAEVRGLALSPSGAALLAACGDNSAHAFNVAHTPGQPLPADFGKALGSFAHAGPVEAVAFQNDSVGFVTAGADKAVKAWRFPQDAPLRNLVGHSAIVDALAFSPDGQTIATCGHDGTVRFWKAADGAALGSVSAFAAPIYCLAFSKDGKQLLAGSFARAAKLIDVEKKAVVRDFADLAEKAFPLGAYDGPFAAAVNRAFPSGHRDGVFAVAFAPDGQSVVTASSDGQILVWGLDGAPQRAIQDPALAGKGPQPETRAHRDWINHLRFTPDGTKLVSVGHAGWLKVWSFADGRLLYQQRLPSGLYSVACSPDGKTLATANHDGTAFILKMP